MASIGHIAVGMAAARLADRPERRPPIDALVFWSAVSLLPDIDVIGFSFGVRYADPWGHRGATHSFTAAALLGIAGALAARRVNARPLRTGLLIALVVASHAVLDTMTDGGLGCALFWPFHLARYFAPWRPIPVAPIGAAFFTAGGASVALIELLLFAPLFVFALKPPGARLSRALAGVLLAGWVAVSWLLISTDPVRDAVVGALVREDTAYARGFSETAFRAVTRGETASQVRARLGTPAREQWFYLPRGVTQTSAMEISAAAFPDDCMTMSFENGQLAGAAAREPCRARGIEARMSPDDVQARLGPPTESCWSYTWSPGNRRYRVRVICFGDGRVDAVLRHWN